MSWLTFAIHEQHIYMTSLRSLIKTSFRNSMWGNGISKPTNNISSNELFAKERESRHNFSMGLFG